MLQVQPVSPKFGRILPAVLLLAGLGALDAFAASTDQASGSLTIAGQTIPLRHVFAYSTSDPDEGPRQIEVLLTDEPLPEDVAQDVGGIWTGLDELVKEGRIRGLKVSIDAGGKVRGAQLLLQKGGFIATGSSYTPEIQTLDATAIRARLYRTKNGARTGQTRIGAVGSGSSDYEFDVTFTASIRPLIAEWTPPEPEDASPEAIASRLRALRSRNPLVRRAGVLALHKMEPPPSAAIPALVEALKGASEVLRNEVVGVLSRMEGGLGGSVPALVEIFQGSDVSARIGAALVLAHIEGVDHKAVVPVLVEALTQRDRYSYRLVADVLGRLGPEAREAIPALVEDLGGSDRDRQAAAAGALGQIGPEAKAAVPALTALLQDLSPEAALDPAAQATPTKAQQMVRQIKKSEQERQLLAVAEALGRIDPEAEAAIPALVVALGSQIGPYRKRAAEALERMGPEGQAALRASGAAAE